MLGQQGTTSVLLVEVEFVVLDVVADVVEDAPVDAAHGGGGIEVARGVVLFVDVLQIGWNGARDSRETGRGILVGSLKEFLLLHLKLLFPSRDHQWLGGGVDTSHSDRIGYRCWPPQRTRRL